MPPKTAPTDPKESTVDTDLLQAIAVAALQQLDRQELREHIVGLIAQQTIAKLRPAEIAQSIVDEHGAEIGSLLIRAILRGD